MSHAPVPTLVGDRCVLRALRPSDAPSLQRHADDPEVAYNLFDGFPQPYTLADAQAWCGELHRQPQFGYVWGIEVASEIVGCISVAPQGGLWRSSAVIGYWLGREHWRRGVVSGALTLVTDWAWATLPQTTRLWMPIFARNLGSRKVALRCGYGQESFMPYSGAKAGEAIDVVTCAAYRPGLPVRRDPLAPPTDQLPRSPSHRHYPNEH